MNKYKNAFVWIISIIAFIVLAVLLFSIYSKNAQTQKTIQPTPIFHDDIVKHSGAFSDGLNNPDSITTYELDDFPDGLSQKQVFYIDVNGDGKNDKITKSFYETGNAHSYYEYKIEIKDGDKYVNITPQNLKTVNGANCDLQQIQFAFKPRFQINMIYREMGDTWNEPTMAYKKTFTIKDGKMISNSPQKMYSVCDVKQLF